MKNFPSLAKPGEMHAARWSSANASGAASGGDPFLIQFKIRTPEQIAATVLHETGHLLVARSFRANSRLEIFTEPVSNAATKEGILGLCHYDRDMTPFALCASGWGGILAETITGAPPRPGWPPFKPSARSLKAWCSMVMASGCYGSSSDRLHILSYKNPWLGCRRAYRTLRRSLGELRYLARLITDAKLAEVAAEAAAVSKAQAEAEDALWAGIPRPSVFPASKADFVSLVALAPERFAEFKEDRARAHLFGGAGSDHDAAEYAMRRNLGSEEKFNEARAIAEKLMAGIYENFHSPAAWLAAVRTFRDWESKQQARSEQKL